MWAILAVLCWVVYDVAVIIIIAGKISDSRWWLLVAGGIALIFFTGISAVLDFLAQRKLESQVGLLRTELDRAQSNLAGRMDALALFGGETFRQLRTLTQTGDDPAAVI